MNLNFYNKFLNSTAFYVSCWYKLKNRLNLNFYNEFSNFWLNLFVTRMFKKQIIFFKKNWILSNLLVLRFFEKLIRIEVLKFILKFQFEKFLSNNLKYKNYKNYLIIIKKLFNFPLQHLLILNFKVKKQNFNFKHRTILKTVFFFLIKKIYSSFFFTKVLRINNFFNNFILIIQIHNFYNFKSKIKFFIFKFNTYIFFLNNQIKTKTMFITYLVKTKQFFNFLFQFILNFKIFYTNLNIWIINTYFLFKVKILRVYFLNLKKFKYLNFYCSILKKFKYLLFFYFVSNFQQKLLALNFLSFNLNILVLLYKFFFKKIYTLTLINILKYKFTKIKNKVLKKY